MRASTAGGFSEYVEIVDFKLGKSAVLVDEKVNDKQAVLIEPFLIGCNSIRPLNVESGKKAIVFGAGTIGMTAAIALKHLGCQVVVCDIIPSRLQLAKELGLEVCHTIEDNYVEKCKEILGVGMGATGEAIDADYYVDAAENQAVIDLFFQGAKAGAKLSIVAVHHKPVTMNLIPITYGALQIYGPNGNYHNNLPLTLEILESQKFDVEKLITHVFSHNQIVEALEKSIKNK